LLPSLPLFPYATLFSFLDLCGRKGVPKSVICDPENLLSKNSKDVIEGRIIEIEHKSKLQFGIAVVRSMFVLERPMFVLESQIDKEAKRFAESLHTTWGVGNKNTENGVLVFLAIDDRVVHISTGKGVKDKLTDVTIQSIIQHMRPYLKKEQYGEAIEAGVLEMDMVMENKSIGPSFLDLDQYGFFIIASVVVMGLCSHNFYKERQEAKLKEGKVALKKLMHEVKSAEDNKFQFDSCPICLEDFSVRRDPTDPEDSPHDHPYGNTDADSLLSSASHGSSAYTSSAEYREVRNLIPGASASPSSPSSSSSLSSDGMRPMTLHCGHVSVKICLWRRCNVKLS
jgi:hypothetical protein